MKKILLTFGCCLHGMFDEILLFCTLFMAFMTTKTLKLVKGMDHPGIFSLTVCKKKLKIKIRNWYTDSQPWCLFFFLTQTKPNATLKCRITQPRFQRACNWQHFKFNSQFFFFETGTVHTISFDRFLSGLEWILNFQKLLMKYQV